MKTLKMNLVESSILNEKEMSAVQGGRDCTCGCLYANNGGSTTDANGKANSSGGPNGLHSPGVKKAAYNADGDYYHK